MPSSSVEEYAKQETNINQEASKASFLFGLFYDTEGGGEMFFRNVC
jgi:hypothetical protein